MGDCRDGYEGIESTIMQGHRILAVFAHPDDESFGPGGTLAKYARQGIPIFLLTATRGEAGEITYPTLLQGRSLAEVRTEELRCAAQTLGIQEVVLLGYRDSGMQGDPENAHPEALIQAEDQDIAFQIVQYIRMWRPTVVLTFEPHGGYGHPDHIKISRVTRIACEWAADAGVDRTLGPPWQILRLIYTAIPKSQLLALRKRLHERGSSTREIDQFLAMGAGWEDAEVNLWVDVSSTLHVKWEAMRCHRTQIHEDHPFLSLPEQDRQEIFSREAFAVAWPPLSSGRILSDFFEGLPPNRSN